MAPMGQTPLKTANDKWPRQRALEYREQRLRPNDEHQEELPEELGVDNPTPYDRKEECREWHVSNDMWMCAISSGISLARC